MKKKSQRQMTAEQIYKSNKKKVKWLEKLTPIIFWLLMALMMLFFCLAVQNSVGNVIEIINLLDNEKYNNVELKENYLLLKDKWGEMIIFGDDNMGLSVKYINIGKALFSGLMITFTTLTIIFLLLAIIIGKISLPSLIKTYKDNNNELVDITTLRMSEEINNIAGKKEKNKKVKEEWF